MPVIIPFIIAAVGAYAGATALTIAIVQIAAAIAIGAAQASREKRKARDAYNRSVQDRLFTVRSGVAPRRYVLGTIRTGGVLMYADSVGLNKIGFDAVTALASNVCSIDGYYIGDEYIAVADFPGDKYGRVEERDVVEHFTVTGPTAVVHLSGVPLPGSTVKGSWSVGPRFAQTVTAVFGPGTQVALSNLPNQSVTVDINYKLPSGDKLRAQFKNGSSDQTVDAWPDYPAPLWDSDHRLRGVCHIRSLYLWDENLWPQGAPQVGAVLEGGPVDGLPFYDPRTGANPNYTDNPAILWAWWRVLPRRLGGMGVPSDYIDWQSVGIAANICDELITVRTLDGGSYTSVKRYQCHTVLLTDATAAENEDIILGSMAGRSVYTNGKYRLVAGSFRTAAVTIKDRNVIGTKPLSLVTADLASVPPNTVTARFADATANWQETQPKPVQNSTYLDKDGHEETLDIALPATTDPRQANYLMGVALERARPAFTMTLTVDGIAEDLALLDTVQLSLTNRAAYAGRTFEVVAMIDNWDGTFDLTLAEIKPTTYALDADRFTPSNPTPIPDNSYLWDIPRLANFRVTAQTPTLLPDGTSITRVDLAWDTPPGDYISQGGRIELRYRSNDADWIGIAAVPGDSTSTTVTAAIIDNNVYQFQGRAANSLGAVGPWADAWAQINGTPLPSARAIRLRATSFIFRVPPSGSGTVDPATVTLTLDRQGGLTAPAVWETTPPITLSGTGDTRVLAFGDLNVDAVRIDVEVEQDNKLYLDAVTVVKVYDGDSSPDYIPDHTPPPGVTSLAATAQLFHIFLQWDQPIYTEGHGHASTEIYGVLVPTVGPQPTFANAKLLGGTPASVYSHPASTGETWAFWAKNKSVDGILSTSPAGGTNGVQATTGKIGNVNLGPLIVEAGNLANDSVTAAALADGIIDATKFASGIEPVSSVTVGPLPTTRLTGAILYNGVFYTWSGSAYVLPAADVSGSIPANSITSTQIADDAITTPKLAANAVTANEILAGAVTAGKIAANAVTAATILAGAITAGKIAAGAVNATAIAAGAITASKILVSGQGAALNDDPAFTDAASWNNFAGVATLAVNAVVSTAPGGQVGRLTGSGGILSRPFPIITGKQYRISVWARRVQGTGNFYLRLYQYDTAGTLQAFALTPANEALTLTSGFVRYTGITSIAAGAVTGNVGIYGSDAGTASAIVELADARCEQLVAGELVVDGAITATKLAANSIAVGTAAVQNAAITNAMIANLAVDDAKISSLSAAKITAGTLDAARIGAGSITTDKLSVLSQGGTSIDMSNGRIVFNNGAFMRVQGVGFGSSNQFLDWYGPTQANISSCTEALAIQYLKTNGQAYFGGALNANIAKNAIVGTDTTTAATVTLGPFGSFGRPKQVSIAYQFSRVANRVGVAGPGGGPASAILVLERRTTGSFVTLANSPLNAVETVFDYHNDGFTSVFTESMAGSLTFTDVGTGTSNHEYRATLTSRTIRTIDPGWTISLLTQQISITSIEDLT